MKLLSWNCRRLGNRATIRALDKILQSEKPDIVFLMETKLSTSEMRKINVTRLHFEGCLAVDCEGLPTSRRGGLCMLWMQPFDLHLISYSAHHMMFRVTGDGDKSDWFCSGIYGWPDGAERYRTWQLLDSIKRDKEEGWLCMGDFNEIMWSFEKRGGNPKTGRDMEMFREGTKLCSLSDLGFPGWGFTWSNGRQGDMNIREMLGRFLANLRWKEVYMNYKVKHLSRYKSDHSPIILLADVSTEVDVVKERGF